MRTPVICAAITLGVGLPFAHPAWGAKLAYDGFAYAPGALAGDGPTPGSGFTAPWLGDAGVVVNAPGLSSPFSLPSVGNAVEGDFNYFAPLATTLNTQDFWASFLLFHSGPNDQTYMGLSSTLLPPTQPPEVAFGVRLGQYGLFSSAFGGGFLPAPTPFSPAGSTDFLLTHFQPSGGSWLVPLYVNPTAASLGSPDLIAAVPLLPYDEVLNQNQLQFRSDEVRIGTDPFSAGLIPEPTSLAILSIALLLAAPRRHRRHRASH
jgi:hypothetical protein